MPLWGIFIKSSKKEEKANNELIMTHFLPLLFLNSPFILSSSECLSWIDMQSSYFHFTPNRANNLFVWIRFKMSESAHICVNCNYTDSHGISFSLLFHSNQSCVSNSVPLTVCYPCLSRVNPQNSQMKLISAIIIIWLGVHWPINTLFEGVNAL